MLSHLEPYVEDADVVVDIGGGYGGLARLLKKRFPKLRLVLLDLAGSQCDPNLFPLHVLPRGPSAHFLRDVHLSGRASIPGHSGPTSSCSLDSSSSGSHKALSDSSSGTRSMMEMDLPTVSFYIGHIQDKLPSGGSFYCVNRYEKKTRLKAYPFDDKWYVSHSAPWPKFIDENPHHELVAVRARYPVLGELREHVASFPPFPFGIPRIQQKLMQRD